MKKLLTWNSLLIFCLIVWGATVRNFGAGLSCPDWPLCHGKIIPPMDLLVFIEWGHRLLASIVGFLTLAICIVAWRSKEFRKKVAWISTLSVILVIIQAVFGGMTVKGLLAPHWVSGHLALGLLFFLSMLWMLLRVELRVFEKARS